MTTVLLLKALLFLTVLVALDMALVAVTQGRKVQGRGGLSKSQGTEGAPGRASSGMGARPTLLLALLALLLVGCYPKVKVYGPVSDPCTLQPQAPPVTQASTVQNPDLVCREG